MISVFKRRVVQIALAAMIANPLFATVAQANVNQRYLMDVVDVQGIRENQLVGYGLVVGLDGTGDKNQVTFTGQSVVNMLKQFGVQTDGNDPKLKNVAAVAVSATIPAMASPGQSIDITVSSIGDAKSLRGGTLLMTPLRGIDGEVYAIAQGNLVAGGLFASGQNGSSVTVNTPTVASIPNGAVIEAAIPTDFNEQPVITLNLKHANFTTARNIERAVNQLFGPDVAQAENNAKVVVRAPASERERVTFMSLLEEIQIDLGRKTAKVVFNSRTGTVVLGGDVMVRRAAVSHGNLTVTINEQQVVSQPNGGNLGDAEGETVVTTDSDVNVTTENNPMFIWPEGTSLDEIVRAVNGMGATPTDLMAILQALEEAGALEAELVVI